MVKLRALLLFWGVQNIHREANRFVFIVSVFIRKFGKNVSILSTLYRACDYYPVLELKLTHVRFTELSECTCIFCVIFGLTIDTTESRSMVLIQCTFQDEKFLRDNERIDCVRNYNWDVILRVTKTSDHWSMAICCGVSRSRIWYYTELKLKMMYISALALLKKQIISKWLNRYPTCILSFNQITEFDILVNITLTSLWARWRLGSPASRLFTQAFIQAHINENVKAPCHWSFCSTNLRREDILCNLIQIPLYRYKQCLFNMTRVHMLAQHICKISSNLCLYGKVLHCALDIAIIFIVFLYYRTNKNPANRRCVFYLCSKYCIPTQN